MYIAKVIGKAVSIVKHPAYENRTLLLIQPLSVRSELVRTPTIAVDYVGAGEGDTVIVGAGPGVAQEVFGIEDAPIRELVMGIVDRVDINTPGGKTMKRITLSICCLIAIGLHLSACRVAQVLSTQYSQNIASATYGTEANHPGINDGNLETLATLPARNERNFIVRFAEIHPVPKDRHSQWQPLPV